MPKGRDRTAVQAYEQAKRVVNGHYGHINYSNIRPVTLENMKRSGVDCSGFIYWIFGFHTSLSTRAMPGILPHCDFISYRWGEVTPQKGDVFCWVNPNPNEMGHTTFYIGNGQIYHSTTGGPRLGSSPGLSTSNTYIFRPKEGWDEVPVEWELKQDLEKHKFKKT